MKAACSEFARSAADIHQALDMSIEPEQRPAVERAGLPPALQDFIDGAGDSCRARAWAATVDCPASASDGRARFA